MDDVVVNGSAGFALALAVAVGNGAAAVVKLFGCLVDAAGSMIVGAAVSVLLVCWRGSGRFLFCFFLACWRDSLAKTSSSDDESSSLSALGGGPALLRIIFVSIVVRQQVSNFFRMILLNVKFVVGESVLCRGLLKHH